MFEKERAFCFCKFGLREVYPNYTIIIDGNPERGGFSYILIEIDNA
jgi:hypothetical protein